MTVYKVIQVVGTSDKSFSHAVKSAVKRASETLHDIRWFEVKEMRGRVADGGVSEYQVKIDIAFHLHDPDAPAQPAKAAAAAPAKRRR